MSDSDRSNPKIGPVGPMYINDFLNYLKARNPTSQTVVIAAIQAARLYGPLVANAEKVSEDTYRIRVHVGYGLQAIIEMDRDKRGRLQPVFGEIL